MLKKSCTRALGVLSPVFYLVRRCKKTDGVSLLRKFSFPALRLSSYREITYNMLGNNPKVSDPYLASISFSLDSLWI